MSQRDEGNGFVEIRSKKHSTTRFLFFLSSPFANPLARFGKLGSYHEIQIKVECLISSYLSYFFFLFLSLFFLFLVVLFILRVDLGPPLERES